MNKPFCFRCGVDAKYQIEIHKRREDLVFWPLCATCVAEIPWVELLTNVVSGEEMREAAEEIEEEGYIP